MAKKSKDDLKVIKVRMGRFKVHGKTIQYRELDDNDDTIMLENKEAPTMSAIYVSKDAFDNEKGPKKLTVKLVWK